MKVKLLELANSRAALNEIVTIPLPASTSFLIKRAIDKANAELEPAQEEVVKAHERNKDDNDKFTAEVNELMEQEVNLDIEKVNIGRLGDALVKTETLMALDWLFEG